MLVRTTSANDAGYDTDLLETLSQRVVVGDGSADAVEAKYVRVQSG